jgi:hypothetical protein
MQFLFSSLLAGALPWEWCNGSWWRFDVKGNAGLCDEVPTCLYSRIETFSGTSLIDSINSLDQGKGGCSRAVLLACLASLGLLCLA